MSKKVAYGLVFGLSALVIALVLTLSLTLGLRAPAEQNPGTDVITPPPSQSITFVSPTKECVVGQHAAFDKLVWNDTLRQWRTHNGVDFSASVGDEVYSIADGKVTKVQTTILDGVVVTVTHADGYVSVYKGLDAASVKADEEVKAGAVLGKVGNMMCEQNQGAHLHLEMKKDGKYVSVADYLDIEQDK